ncbi:hypothetical protein EV385_5151 [Krasilnikovia cinnamomea]|uniref:Uncharacterized protein n=1 Tax=Krasilnikovia cinnamomea TaxID=349313 RepID=A0A4Q7ZQ72_9ACTN|nr:hypothetical protein EV385_5151 [Krasilnikovia cinnamomea]
MVVVCGPGTLVIEYAAGEPEDRPLGEAEQLADTGSGDSALTKSPADGWKPPAPRRRCQLNGGR